MGVLGEHLGGLERSLESLLPSFGESWSHLGPSWLNFELFWISRAHVGVLQASFWSLWGLILDAKWTENPSSVRVIQHRGSSTCIKLQTVYMYTCICALYNYIMDSGYRNLRKCLSCSAPSAGDSGPFYSSCGRCIIYVDINK